MGWNRFLRCVHLQSLSEVCGSTWRTGTLCQSVQWMRNHQHCGHTSKPSGPMQDRQFEVFQSEVTSWNLVSAVYLRAEYLMQACLLRTAKGKNWIPSEPVTS